MKFEVLTAKDMDMVHEKSLDILSRAGMRIASPKVLDMMEKAGCEVCHEESIIKFPAQLIEDCLKLAPRKFMLGSLDGKHDMFLGEGNTYIATDGQGCFAVDMESGESKDSTMKDLTEAARVAGALDYISNFWPIVTAGDAPPNSRSLHEIVEIWKVSNKHITADCFNETQAEFYMEILAEILGGREEIAKRNILSVCCCPITPLIYEGPMLEGTIKLGECGVPVLLLPMPISGTTSPMSLISTVIQNNAENLAGIAILQTAHPGRPILYGSAPGVLDMSSGLFCVSAPEGVLQNTACAQMAREKYGLPNKICLGGADAHVPGIQTATERTLGILSAYLSGSDIICGVGLTGTAQYLYKEEMIIAEDIVGYCKRVADGMRTEEVHTFTDRVIEVGHGGNFLSEKSTVKYLRNGEHYMPKVFCRESADGWKKSPKKDIMAFAKNKVNDILSKPPCENFTPEQYENLKSILANADAALEEA